MLHDLMERNVLFYGMIGAGILGILCIAMVNSFYGRVIRDLRQITEPKGKWTKEFLNEYQMRKTKEQEINNPEVFIRTQMIRGKMMGISLQKWKQGIGYGAFICFLLMMAAVYWDIPISGDRIDEISVCAGRGRYFCAAFIDETVHGIYE